MTSAPIAAIDPIIAADAGALTPRAMSQTQSFSKMLLDGINQVDGKVRSADAAVMSFALDDTVPPHQVMYALEQARHSLTIMMQVRARLVEGYQEIMRMQL